MNKDLQSEDSVEGDTFYELQQVFSDVEQRPDTSLHIFKAYIAPKK